MRAAPLLSVLSVLIVSSGCTTSRHDPDASVITVDVEIRAVCLDAGCDLSVLDGHVILHSPDFPTLLQPARVTTCGPTQKQPVIVLRRARYLDADGGSTEQPAEYTVLRKGPAVMLGVDDHLPLYELGSDSVLSTVASRQAELVNDGGTWTFRYPSGRAPNLGLEESHRIGAGQIDLLHTWLPNCPNE